MEELEVSSYINNEDGIGWYVSHGFRKRNLLLVCSE